MGHGHAAISNPGPFKFSSGMKTLFWVFVLVGAVSFALLYSKSHETAWSIFVVNHFYFMSLALGGLFFAAIQWLTGAMWSAPIRRLAESFTSYLPVVLVTFAIIAIGSHSIYHWTHAELVANDPILTKKAGYLSVPFFVIRNVLAIGVWIFFSWKLIGNSIAQDANGDYRINLKNRAIAPFFLMLFAITYTLAAFDQIMSLDPHWFSTIFGIYCFAGLFYSTLAAICILTLYLKKKGVLNGVINDNHLHDIGKFMFAFTVFWAYIGFSQFMLIWYANLPEETGYYIKRMGDGWMGMSIFLLVGKFILPFFFLLPRGSKRNERMLMGVAWFMLVAHWLDLVWMVQPEFFKDGPRIGVFELGMTLGFVGIFGLCVARFLGRHNAVAIGDPRLIESVHHHHQ